MQINPISRKRAAPAAVEQTVCEFFLAGGEWTLTKVFSLFDLRGFKWQSKKGRLLFTLLCGKSYILVYGFAENECTPKWITLLRYYPQHHSQYPSVVHIIRIQNPPPHAYY